MIALLCAVPLEASRLLAFITAVEAFPLGSKTFFRGALSDQEVALCVGGMGKANAAHAAALLITRFNPGALIIFGMGGAYPSAGAKIGDIALASEEIAGDEGVLTPEGFRDTEYIGVPLVQSDGLKFYNRFPAPKDLLKKAQKRLSRSQPARSLHAGSFVTVSTCTGTSSRARELEARYGGLCENMEGAAAAQVARLHGVPWLEVRGISNMVEDRDMKKWDVPRAALAVQQAVEQILEGWKE